MSTNLPNDIRVRRSDKGGKDLRAIDRTARRRADLGDQHAPAYDVGQKSTRACRGNHLREELLTTGVWPYARVFGYRHHQERLSYGNDDADELSSACVIFRGVWLRASYVPQTSDIMPPIV